MKGTVIVKSCLLLVIYFKVNEAIFQLSTTPDTAVKGKDFSFICSHGNQLNVEFRKQNKALCYITGFYPNKTCQLGSFEVNYRYICDSSTYTVTIPGFFLQENLHKTQWNCVNIYDNSQSSNMQELYVNVPISEVILSYTPADENPVNVISGQTKEFTCTTNAGRPFSRIQWYLASMNIPSKPTIHSDAADDKKISSSRLIYTGNKNDTDKDIYCTALNIEGFLVRSMTRTINVLYSPSTITLTQKPPGTINENTSITFICEIMGGNPLANITWQCNGSTLVDSIGTPMRNDTSISSVRLNASREKDGKSCICIGSHPTWKGGNSTSLLLDIRYAPAGISVTQIPSGYVIESNIVLLTCEISGGNPLATISWSCEGYANVTTTDSPYTDKVVSSIELNVTRNDDGKQCICIGRHPLWIENKEEKLSLNVYFSPEKGPSIIQTPLGSVDEGTPITLTCEVPGGKPLADIAWWCNGSSPVVLTVSPPPDKSISSVQLILNKDDHGKKCICIGSHPAWMQNKSSSIEFDVKYPPVLFQPITQTPNRSIIENNLVSLTCEILGGNPLANISWQCGGFTKVIPSGILLTDRAVSRIEKNVTKEDNGKTCSCTGQHRLWLPAKQKRSHTLNVYYSSTVEITNTQPSEVVENTTMVLNCSDVDGNPRNASFVWKKSDTTIGDTPNYYVRKVNVTDAGNYTCQGSNGFGKESKAVVEVHVLYSPRVSALSALYGSTIGENDTAVLQCIIQSNPPPITVVWMKRGNNKALNSDGAMFIRNLTINKSNCLDTSNYTCKAMNIINNIAYSTMRDIELFVNCSPRQYDGDAGSINLIGLAVGENLTILEHILAYPIADVTWYFKEDRNASNKQIKSAKNCSTYNVFDHQLCFSRLNLTENDFGLYSAVVVNDLGYTTFTYMVNPQEQPYKSTNVNVTCGILRAEISWMTAYNGGQEQQFYITTTDTDGFQLMHYTGEVGNEKEVTKIHSLTMPAGLFSFDIFGNNSFGNATGKGASCEVKDQLKSLPVSTALVGGIAGSISALLIVIIVIGALYVCRRRQCNGRDNKLIKRHSKDTDEDEEGLQVNPLYVTAGEASNVVDGPVYGIVNKKKQSKENIKIEDNDDQVPVYSEVHKTQSQGKKIGKEKKIKKTSRNENRKDIELGNVYGNSERYLEDNNDDGVYANEECKPERINNSNKIYTQKKNKDGLIYADLDLDPGSSGKKFVIRGLENRTNYAVIDLTVKVDPLPSDDDDEGDQGNENVKHTSNQD